MKNLYQGKGDGPAAAEGPGLVHVCYGQGVGKTSRVVGLAVRAAGAGLSVAFIQFMKSGGTSEAKVFAKVDNIRYFCPGPHPFIRPDGPTGLHFEHAAQALEHAWAEVEAGVDLLVCDEILNTLLFGLLKEEQVLDLIAACRGRLELALTGADAPQAVIDAADYVTEFKMVKHPYNSGTPARLGVEF